jgi:hypothetical protein
MPDGRDDRDFDRISTDVREMQRDFNEFKRSVDVRVGVHEQKCASRYMTILVFVGVSIALNLPNTLPHILSLIQLAK